MGPCDLDAMLAALPRATPEFARLLDTRDDAAVFDLGDGRCLVQTVDFFPPIVDSGYWFGQHRGRQRALRRVRHGRRAPSPPSTCWPGRPA